MKFNVYTKEKTDRVKSLAFHPTYPHLLLGTHTGSILCYDTALRIFTHEFVGHSGPVRCVHFHPIHNLFASCGDDQNVRVWDYTKRKVVSVLRGHIDYVRSVNFHPTEPYLLSCSDDQTIKVWNFQTNKLLATLTGHIHYVMDCKFFNKDFILSASLDQTLRMWDYSNIRKKSFFLSQQNVVLSQIVDGHDRGINKIAINDENSFCSCSDDREVKLWELRNGMVYEKCSVGTHQGSVTSAVYIKNTPLSAGEDGIISYGNTGRFKMDTRFWCVDFSDNFIAAGHDTGFVIFNIEPVNPIYAFDSSLFLFKNGSIVRNDLKREINYISLKKKPSAIKHRKNRMIVQYPNYYELYDGTRLVESERGTAYFGNEFAIDYNGLTVTEGGRKTELGNFEEIFESGDFLFGFKNGILSVIKGRMVVNTINCFKPTGVYVNSSCSFDIKNEKTVVSKNNGPAQNQKKIFLVVHNDKEISVYDENLNIINGRKEVMPIITGFIDNNNFYYSTSGQIKYIGIDSGVLKGVGGFSIFTKNEDGIYGIKNKEVEFITIDTLEIEFKAAVRSGDPITKKMIESGDLPGLSPVNFLLSSTHSLFALKYLNDPQQKFALLLRNNKFEDALEIADSEEMLKKLGDAAVRNCNDVVAEKCYQRLGDTHKLFLLYLCTRNDDKIKNLYSSCEDVDKIGIAKYLNEEEYIYELFKKKLGCKIDNELVESKQSVVVSFGDKKNNCLNRSCNEYLMDLKTYDSNECLGKYGEFNEDVEHSIVSDTERLENEIIDKNNLFFVSGRNVNEDKGADLLENKIIMEDEFSDAKETLGNKNNVLDYCDGDVELYNKVKEFIVDGVDDNKIIAEADVFTTKGQFNKALRLYKTVFYSKFNAGDVCKNVIDYIAGLSAERFRKNTNDSKKKVSIALFTCELNFKPEHKKLFVNSSFATLCKNNNFLDASKISEKFNLKKVEKKNNAIDVGSGVFCFDVMEFRKEAVHCDVCGVGNSGIGKCALCLIGNAK